jgi:hypothetical protein
MSRSSRRPSRAIRLCARAASIRCCARGYTGGPDHFRHSVARYRPRPSAEAYLRLRTLQGEQGQVDWAHFGKIDIGRARRPLMAFVMVLSYSTFFNAVPRTLLYDNLRSAVLERIGDAIRFHPTLLELAAW